MAESKTHDAPGPPREAASRRQDIQGLRTIAVLAVLVFHATDLLPGGFVGVDMFFVISGYVITLMLMREQQRHGRIRLARFYVRRFKRLTPALAVVGLFTVITSVALLSPLGAQQNAAVTSVAALLMLANVAIARTTGGYFDAAAELNPLLHTWSLSVEEQFYLLFPLLLTIAWSFTRRRATRANVPLVTVATVGSLSLGLALILSSGVSVPGLPDTLVGFYGPATRVWEFAVGALLALAGMKAALRSATASAIAATLGLVGLVLSLVLIDSETTFPGTWTLLPVTATALLLVAGTRSHPASGWLSSRPMVLVGDLSYSLYLWHWPFIVFATILWPQAETAPLVAALASVIPAWMSFNFIEQPLRSMAVTKKRMIALAAAVLTPPILMATIVKTAADHDYWNDSVRSYRSAIESPHISSTTPADCTTHTWTKIEECTWNAGLEGQPIYLVGDSNADHFSEAVVESGTRLDRPVQVLAQVGCTFADIRLRHTQQVLEDLCNDYVQETTRVLAAEPPGTVVIANAYLWWNASSTISVGLPGEEFTDDPTARFNALERGLASSISTLQSAGHEVIIVEPIPHWGDGAEDLSWAGCSVFGMIQDSCAYQMGLQDAELRQARTSEAVVSATTGTQASVVSLAEEICPQGTCESITTDGFVRYRDGTHITVDQAYALVPVFTQMLD